MSETGKIFSCVEASAICGYRCCDQDVPVVDEDVNPMDYILMYPGEFNPADPRQQHLTPVGDYNGGVLARCEKECFDQSQCHPNQNYKPLDCMSYPQMPVPTDGKLSLVKDSRCPLTAGDIPPSQSSAIVQKWQEAILANRDVLGWLSSLSLEGYEAL